MCLKQEIIHSTCAVTDRERERGFYFFYFFIKTVFVQLRGVKAQI